jgi:linoleoyl-CoA desaturase
MRWFYAKPDKKQNVYLYYFSEFMSMVTATPKFSTVQKSFHTELKRRINSYFKESGKSATGDTRLYTKAIILFSSFVFLYIHLVFFTPSMFWAIVECIVLGWVTAGIGFNIMHDGAHGSFSKVKWVNHLAAFFLNILGGSHFMWNMKHNVIQHKIGRA